MYEEVAILDQAERRHKPPWDLTDDEVFQLMQAFTQGTTCVTDDECLTLCHWARQAKRGAYVLRLVLDGCVRVTVQAGAVYLDLPTAASGGCA